MREQNIYDDPSFFDGYQKLRQNPSAANDLVEKPALFSLLPDVAGKAVVDLGCGYGENCREFSRRWAAHVVGIDISEKMLAVAAGENQLANVRFLRMSMNDLTPLEGPFDLVVSSLAVHYIEDFDTLLRQIHRLLTPGGTFVFSQEHPFTTALMREPRWTRDGEGRILHYNLTDYSRPGERTTNWIVEGVVKYHRPFSAIFSSLARVGFMLEQVLEPVPDEAVMDAWPAYRKNIHKPDFLLVRAARI